MQKRTEVSQNKSKQRAQQSVARKAKRAARGSSKFKNNSQVHNGGSRGQSGQPGRAP